MKNLTLSTLLAFLTFSAYSQMAIDITVTDSDGEEHELFEDYLDQNKTVVLKMFFTSCPPCRSIAPSFQQLYEDWGSGNDEVEFIELSTQSFDHNQNIQNYKAEFGLTMPTVGVDGGSIAASNTYNSGVFGQFTGTPLFVVISPDRSVNYDVAGSGNAGTISAINQAIIDSREIIVTPDPPLFTAEIIFPDQSQISQPLTLIAEPLPGAPSHLTTQNFNIAPDQNGIYMLDATELENPQFYSARLAHGNIDNVDIGLSTLDLIRIQRQILGIDPFTSFYQFLAADANFDNTVNVLDLLKIQQIIIGLDNDLGPENYVIANECHRLTQSFNFTDLMSSECPLQFVYLKVGDLGPF